MNSKFKTGSVLVTQQINYDMKKNTKFLMFCENSLIRHKSCDWGDLSEDDINENISALENNNRLFSSYIIPEEIIVENETKIWIITEWDRSATTILFPSEY